MPSYGTKKYDLENCMAVVSLQPFQQLLKGQQFIG